MSFSKLFTSQRARDKQNELNSIIMGYPLTDAPVVPDILRHQVDFKHIKTTGGTQLVGLTLAHEGSDLVRRESIELMRNRILMWFPKHAGFTEQFNAPLPNNAIAISISMHNFEVGDSCHEFKLLNKFKQSGHFTYRKMSECVQCCYYNENGVEHLAGMTFYPAPHGAPKFNKSNDVLMIISNNSVIAYPSGDRNESYMMKTYKMYGRFCATAGRHVLVKLHKVDSIPRHSEFDHVTKKWKNVLCKECLEEFFTYKWVEPKEDIPTTEVVPAATQEAAAAPVTEKAAAQDAETAVTQQASTSELSAVSRADSTESLLEGFDKIDVKSNDDDDSDIDAELID